MYHLNTGVEPESVRLFHPYVALAMTHFRLSLASVLSFMLATVAALRFPLRREEPNTHYDTNGGVYDFGVVNVGGDPLTVYVSTLYAEDRPFKVPSYPDICSFASTTDPVHGLV